MDIQKEREAFEQWYLEHHRITHMPSIYCPADALYGGAYTNTLWTGWQAAKAQAVPEGFVLINAESLAFHAKSIRMFNDGDSEHQREEIEDHVCSIEAMIEVQEPAND